MSDELEQYMEILTPEYNLINKSCTETEWPQHINLLITKFPATEKEGFSKGLVGYVANRAYQNMNNNSLLYIITPSYKEDKTRPFSIVEIFEKAGFKFVDTIPWVKNKFIPTQGSKRLNNVFDFIFMFSKGDNYHLDRSSISYLRNKLSISNDEDYLCSGNVWIIPVEDRDVVPVELIECCIKLSNLLPNSTIVDPFMNSGSSLIASINNGHSFWGCEIDKNKVSKCKKIVKDMNFKYNINE